MVMTQERLDKAVVRQRKMHKQASTSRVVGEAEMTMTHRIDPDLFYNGVVNNGGVNPWDDPGYVRDMERILPEIRVTPTTGKIMVGGRGISTGLRRNRFGRPSVCIRYDKQGNRHEARASA